MFLESVAITGSAVFQSFVLGAIGFFLLKKNVLRQEGLNVISRLVIEVTLPLLIFARLIQEFSFTIYPKWWLFPLLSIAITALGLLVGTAFAGFVPGAEKRRQFLSLIAFQNSGYLPLVLLASMLPKDKSGTMFIYLFLFLMGFNLLVWSLGVYMLTFHVNRKFELGSLFSPPVLATAFSLVFIFLGLNRFVPEAIVKPLRMVGDCTLPLAMFVVGGNLASINLGRIDKKEIALMVLAKLIIMPLLGLALIIKFNVPELIGFLILLELAVPPATSLSVITTHYKKEDLLISQGIFFGHIISILTMPLFLSLYFARIMVQ